MATPWGTHARALLWGGKRAGAGRPKKTAETVPHARRPGHAEAHPVHVTLHVRKGVPSLRGSRLFRRLRTAFQQGRERFGFRLAHYSVQGNHLHFIAEAQDQRALSRGMQGLAIRIAKAVNRVHARRGTVFSERYFSRALKTALHVRRALVYVLFNERHHLAQCGLSLPPWWLDACSSAAEFTGFIVHPELPDPPLISQETTAPARTYLLSTAWRRLGRIRIEEEPARPRTAA
jgi:REP element-mobilizing transposase RayT